MNTLPKGYLFGIKDGKVCVKDKLFIPCDRYHPDSARFVVLSESPCKENNFKSVTVMARYVCGKYHGVVTGDELPIISQKTTWTESSIAEAPYHIAGIGSTVLYNEGEEFEEYEEAASVVNNLNLGTFGSEGYTVVNQYGIPVDGDGHLYF